MRAMGLMGLILLSLIDPLEKRHIDYFNVPNGHIGGQLFSLLHYEREPC